MVFTLANVGLPGTSGFVGEFLTLLGAFRANSWIAIFAATGVILSAAYALWLYRRIIFGALVKPVARQHPGPHVPRMPHPGAAGGAHHPVGRLSQAGVRHVGRLRAATRHMTTADAGIRSGSGAVAMISPVRTTL